MSMNMNMTTKQTSSDGAWQGDNPLNHAFPLLIIQATLVLFITRLLSFLLRPLRQPKVIAEILGGILLGPSALGRYGKFTQLVFPPWSTPILESVASIGLLFFLFLVGLELDLSSIRRSGRRAFGIAVAGISLPFLFAAGVTFLLRKVVRGEDKVGYVQCLVFMGVALSITAFPVLARILAELKLLTTQIGETAMAAAAFNDVVAWILLALAVALAGNGTHKSPLVSLWVLFSGVAFVVFMMVAVRPVMAWVVRKCSSEHDFIDEAYICLTLAGVLMSGFLTDLIGIHAIFGAFVFGLIIPKGGEFPARVIKRIEDFVSGLMLPLYFASSGLKTDVGKIQGAEAWGLLVLVISTACAGKILGTFLVAMLCMIPARESLALGVLMNTKGLVELIVLNIGKEKKVLNDEMFAILVLMALFTTFMTTPAVMAIYSPARQSHSSKRRSPLTDGSQEELRVLACIYGPRNVPSLINLIDSIRAVNKSPLKLYVMHLVELTDRSSSIMMVQRARKNGFPFINRFRRGGDSADDHIAVSLAAYGQVGQVTIRHSTAISALPTMHEDVCHVAREKRVAMILLPFHKQRRGEDRDETLMQNVGHGWRGVNQRILDTAPCSVAVLVDRGFGGGSEQAGAGLPAPRPKRVCIMFFGWQDDQVPKALELGERMAEHPTIRVTLMRFIGKEDKEVDDAAIDEFHKKWVGSVNYIEKTTVNLMEDVLLVGKSGEYDLIIAGKSKLPSNMGQHEHTELGPVGDLLASSGHNIVSSVLVIQEHELTQIGKNQATTMNHDKDSVPMVTIEESNV